jgi:hypothetical protein
VTTKEFEIHKIWKTVNYVDIQDELIHLKIVFNADADEMACS